jgi:carboxyl-terminal processing protease
VVLVDRETASTSETLAGALQAQGRALLLGEQTFGKGRTQQITSLRDGSTLLITRNIIYTPAHALIDKVYHPLPHCLSCRIAPQDAMSFLRRVVGACGV